MLTYDVGMRLQVSTAQKAAQVRDRVAAYIATDPDVALESWSAARVTQRWLVCAVNTTTSDVQQVDVEADDEAGARAQFPNPPWVIAYVTQVKR